MTGITGEYNVIGKLDSVDFNKKTGEIVITDGRSFSVLTVYFSEMPADIKVGSRIEFEIRTSFRGNRYGKFIKLVDDSYIFSNEEKKDFLYEWNPLDQEPFEVKENAGLYEWDATNQELFNADENLELYEWGEQVKTNFVEKVAPNLGLDLVFADPTNKESGKVNLIDRKNNRQGDIQVQETPFFTSGDYLYCGIWCDPSYTVSLNKENYDSYALIDGDFDIYYLVHWKKLQGYGVTVEKVQGLWVTSFAKLRKAIEKGGVSLHRYWDRDGEKSYLLNLNDTNVFTRYL